jgi:hypothetical protein
LASRVNSLGTRHCFCSWPDFAEFRTTLALAAPASGKLTLETAPVVRSDCDLTPAPPATRSGPAAALLAPFGTVSY